MKKYFYAVHACLFFLFLFLTCLSSRAQFKKGQVLLGGNIGLFTQNLKPGDPALSYANKSTQFNFSSSIGWAIRDNLIEGVNLNFSVGNTRQSNPFNTPSDFTQKTQGYGAGYFLRRYKSLGEGFSLFLQGNLNGIYTQYSTTNNLGGTKTQDDKGYTFTLGFNPGLSYAICKRVQVEAGFQSLISLNYTHFDNNELDPSGSGKLVNSQDNTFSLSSALNDALGNVVIGFRFVLGS